jgi:hypothetical protein
MSQQDPIKLIPRNVAALRRGQNPNNAAKLVSGNPVSTRLESGVGNCFPGLECDLRNLERRFFPFLEVDIEQTQSSLGRIVAVDMTGVQKAVTTSQLSPEMVAIYQLIANDLTQGNMWRIAGIQGTFGPLGVVNAPITVADLGLPSLGTTRRLPDAWTAIRLLTEGTEVQLTVRRGNKKRTLIGNRARYLDDNGALAKMFLPGELTQSLCSPWTHDFRDCGCFYWASNHPDIARPPLPSPEPSGPEINSDVPWERADRNVSPLPKPATINLPSELAHYEINAKWQMLNFVLEGRETLGSYQPGTFTARPFETSAELEANLRYAAGVELAVIHEYFAAAFSLKLTELPAAMVDDVTAAHAEFMRVAIGEMRHLRVVNNVLLSRNALGAFEPALRVAAKIPGGQPGIFKSVSPRPALPDVIQDFIDLERPSQSIDGLYARILATLETSGTDEEEQNIRSIMAEGQDHFETFSFIQEWLGRHNPNDYLRASNLAVPPSNNALHRTLQESYLTLLQNLFNGYTLGVPPGAADINRARTSMLEEFQSAAEAVADANFLVAFDQLNDPMFVPINNP